MTMKVLFIDRDGTLIEEPHDNQVDSLDKVRLVRGVIPALLELASHGYRFVMVSNQDGLGTDSFPLEHFETCHQHVVTLFESQGIVFDETFICPHFDGDGCDCRKPRTGLLTRFLARNHLDSTRSAVIGDRKTDLDAEGRIEVETGIGFFDHMLEQIAKHGGFSLVLRCDGDLHVDEHHTVEDVAIVLGNALRKALGDKRGIGRYGFLLPMDESAATVALDLSGRASFVFDAPFPREAVGEMSTEMVSHFFRSLAESLGAALHVSVRGENTHHMVEACFKGVGRSLRQAIRQDGAELPTTKGTLS